MPALEPFLKKRGSVDPKTKAGAFFGRSEEQGGPRLDRGVASFFTAGGKICGRHHTERRFFQRCGIFGAADCRRENRP
jgi:hypothetical protein